MTGRRSAGISRRNLLTGTAGLAGLGVGAAAVGLSVDRTPAQAAAGGQTVPFYGARQAGVTTAPQAHANFVGLNLIDPGDVASLAGVLNVWTQDAAGLTAGRGSLADTEPELATDPSRLTVTVGLGPRVFEAPSLRAKRPGWLRPLPAFSIDRLQERWGQTDVLLQIGSDDPVTLAHATRMLTASVRSKLRVGWVQRGFRTARGTHTDGRTMRNLFGQVDGTVQPPGDRDDLLWEDGSGGQPWLAGGTSLVLRRIAMHMDTWEELDRPGRELAVGRTLDSGAPLSGSREHDDPDFTKTEGGIPMIPASSHIARAHRQADHEQFLRRAYNYDEPPEQSLLPEPVEGGDTSNSGLIFATYQRDPVRQFVPVQQRLADHDDLNTWTTPIGSAVYVILPGATEQSPLGSSLFTP